AWARLVDVDDHRKEALVSLRELATVPGSAGRRAKEALARAADSSVTELLSRDAASKSALQRAEAGRSLARLGDLNRAVALLADEDARVRAAVACSIVRLDADP
ncbi:MAG: hypothetical protein JRI23_36410, partial [Deltaproteobacteria bacterium]|nr:hypothetical protein [Deltaproteobacteria bacterium]MBW2537836.1 hypothetical protein [Deltaproteobacteria bacterium]